MNSPWRIELFGGLQLSQEGGLVINRFQTRKTAALLAYLAFHRDKISAREVLADLLWPDHDPDAARNSLRVALNSLRRQLEPPGVPTGAVLVADRATVHLNPDSFTTDVHDFESALQDEKAAEEDVGRTTALLRAVDLYKGTLLLGWYEEWVDLEQTRLAEIYAGALRRVTTHLTRAGDYERAVEYAQRAVQVDPLREETNRNLMRLYAVLGQPNAAREQYRRLENLLRSEINGSPSAATRELLKQITVGAENRAAAIAESGGPSVPLVPMAAARPPETEVRSASPKGVFAAAIASPSVGNVPLQFTRFVGRERELEQLQALLQPLEEGATVAGETSRLVTLTGPGGSGKTRLAIEAAARLRDGSYAGRVWFVPVADITDAAQIPAALLSSLRLTPQLDSAPMDQITAFLGGDAPALIVLDNLEQVGDPAAEWLMQLLAALPNITALAVSRHRLSVGGEREMFVPPLPTPAPDQLDLEALAANPSVALFIDRARAVRPDFQITVRSAVFVAELCRRLDGLPLAIELVAASIRLLSPQQMLQRLTERSHLLTSERRDLHARHRSLRAVMDESFRLLPEEVHAFFARLSIFRGGWTLDAAQAVCSGDDDALELLDLLQQRSLLVSYDLAEGVRFRFLETIRQYADSKLTEEERPRLRAAHALFYKEFAVRQCRGLNGANSQSCCDQLDDEHENLRAAIAWAIEAAPDMALQITGSLWRFWYARGFVEEGYGLMEAALQKAGQSAEEAVGTSLLIDIHHGAGRLAMSTGNTSAAILHFETAARLADRAAPAATIDLRRRGLHERSALALDCAIAHQARGDYAAAERSYRLLLDICRQRRDPWAEAYALWSLGAVLESLDQDDEAACVYRESDALRQMLGDTWGETLPGAAVGGRAAPSPAGASGAVRAGLAASFLQVGHVTSEQGDYAAAMPLLRESLRAFEQLDDRGGAAIANERIAITALNQGDRPTARRAAEDALLWRGRGSDLSPQAAEYARALLHEIDGVMPPCL